MKKHTNTEAEDIAFFLDQLIEAAVLVYSGCSDEYPKIVKAIEKAVKVLDKAKRSIAKAARKNS